METTILKGKGVADKLNLVTREMIDNENLSPCLVVILIGDDPASEYYVSNIVKQGKKSGIEVRLQKYEMMDQPSLVDIIMQLNQDDSVSGIMLQKPLPKDIDEDFINNLICPDKDVDGFNPMNAGKLYLEQDCFIPCTAESVLEIIRHYQIETESKHIVVIGRSNIVGKPVANLFLHKSSTGNATVTICHSKTKDISNYTRQADILVAAVGKANLIKKEMIKEGCIIIDAGINEIKDESGKNIYVGDIDYQDCLPKCQAITPVPGGVGSVTTSILLSHVARSAKKMKKNK
ncbi:MAG TPA: tetrahydrofolate dehydrogenase/cyclohydrolase catalytic domain-containing protein [Candidatus Cloacimonadota bacterium]|jgi:methylenetetrahydrofolate dehydrogenase (NADP+)/methenyltetrahydrofolate cyclohydrolase|nr:tetrahydrofolate dehydrogenase/cyclohydrolase catalytic domain-containing protein [Candidatus Cloacimonadota bacterium]HPM01211.1 tetrahydrofolate dehydrogenase/cyclohydrolase catalytic domain-containing protein [Candidatus Cloacimonadota bacterium]